MSDQPGTHSDTPAIMATWMWDIEERIDALTAAYADHEQRLRNLEDTEPPPIEPPTVEILDLRATCGAHTAEIRFETNVKTYAYYELHDQNGVVATHKGDWGEGWTEHAHTFKALTPMTEYHCYVAAWDPDNTAEQATDQITVETAEDVVIPPPIDPPIEPPPAGKARGGINISVGGYPKVSGPAGYWHSSTPHPTAAQVRHMVDSLNITHIRGNYAPAVENDADKVIDHIQTYLNGGCTITVANHSWCTGADPSNHNSVMQAFRRIITAGSSVINQAIEDGRFRIEPWNEPSGHDTYKGGFEATVTHSNRWVTDHLKVMEPLLNERPNLGFDLGDTHGGNGGRKPTTSCIAYWGPELERVTTSNLRAGPHYYQGWRPGYAQDFVNMCRNHWAWPVTIGEFGGDPLYQRRGKGPNHHSNIAYPPGEDMLNHWDTLAPHVEEFVIWHGYQAWQSGFTLSDKHDPNTGQGRYAPWQIDGHPRTLIGAPFLNLIQPGTSTLPPPPQPGDPDTLDYLRLDNLND